MRIKWPLQDDLPPVQIRMLSPVSYTHLADVTDEFAGYKDEYYDFAFGLSTYDDKIYGVGIGIAPSAVFYNKDIFEKVGVEVPTTYEELDQVCAKSVSYTHLDVYKRQPTPTATTWGRSAKFCPLSPSG